MESTPKEAVQFAGCCAVTISQRRMGCKKKERISSPSPNAILRGPVSPILEHIPAEKQRDVLEPKPSDGSIAYKAREGKAEKMRATHGIAGGPQNEEKNGIWLTDTA